MARLRQPIKRYSSARWGVKRRGATLLELLVVISMIGMLITILIPSLSRSMDLANDTICKHNLREIYSSLEMYRTENDGWLPVVAKPGSTIRAVSKSVPWFVSLYPDYLPNPMLLTCPEDPFSYRMATAGVQLSDPEVADYPSYGLNSFIMTAGGGFLANTDRHRPSRPHDTILAGDLGPDDAVGRARAASSGPSRNSSLITWDNGFDPFIGGEDSLPWVTQRHGHGINVLTLGGGIRDARTSEIMKQPIRRYYDNCAAGQCAFCKRFRIPHYNFANDHLYWWTGSVPSE
jgi:competence protein ComGC